MTDETSIKQDKRELSRHVCTMHVILGHRDKKDKELKGHHLAVHYTLSHLHNRPVRWKFTSPLFWKASNKVHNVV